MEVSVDSRHSSKTQELRAPLIVTQKERKQEEDIINRTSMSPVSMVVIFRPVEHPGPAGSVIRD